MTLHVIVDRDLALLSHLMPDLDFTDPERAEVLKVMSSCDVQAAPGSGKTTLLAAKLMLLAKKWKYTNRGICVISHTNVAAAEITKRLQRNPLGAPLLGYPHFIGTIHSFINTHLALPLLRSYGADIDSIDNEIFARNAMNLLRSKYKLNTWAKRQKNGEEIVKSLIHAGPDLALACEQGTLPGQTSGSWKQANEIKNSLSARGIFRHADMFAFASKLLTDIPSTSCAASWRFPLVLIDEMQDTDSDQESMLGEIFDETVTVQRFGDRNQRILSNGKNEGKLSFPRNGALSVSSTKRFPGNIAAIVSSVQEFPAEVTSDKVAAHPPAVILYDDSTVASVIDRFGAFVLERLTDEEIASQSVKAICSRKSGNSKAGVGRHVLDYHPSFAANKTTKDGKESVRALLSDPVGWGALSVELSARTRDVTRAMLLCLRAGDSPLVKDVRDATRLFRSIQDQNVDAGPLRLLRHALTTSTGLTVDGQWEDTKSMLFNSLKLYFDELVSLEDFSDALEDGQHVSISAELKDNRVVVERDGRSVTVHVATTASVKGETHLATLVLDGVVHYLNRHDISAAMPSIALRAPMPNKPASIRSAYRGLYVGMSRPTTLLAMATHRERISDPHVAALEASGWVILRVHA